MRNIYRKPLDDFFNRLIALRYNAYRLSTMLKNSIKSYESLDGETWISSSSLVISDISGPTDNGWTINFPTGASKATMAKNYKDEALNLLSIECCYALAQSFEGLERFFKDVVYEKSRMMPLFFDSIKNSKFTENKREKYPGGEKLFSFVRKATGNSFRSVSHTNNYNLKFSEFWRLLSDIRHAITHNNCIIRKNLIFKSKEYTAIFNHFFSHRDVSATETEILLEYRQLDMLVKTIAELAFQIYKMLSIQASFDWEIERKKIKKS